MVADACKDVSVLVELDRRVSHKPHCSGFNSWRNCNLTLSTDVLILVDSLQCNSNVSNAVVEGHYPTQSLIAVRGRCALIPRLLKTRLSRLRDSLVYILSSLLSSLFSFTSSHSPLLFHFKSQLRTCHDRFELLLLNNSSDYF